MRVYGGSDYAVTADGGDYTGHLVVGLDPEGRMYLLDRWRKQTASDEWIEAFCDLVTEWKPVGWLRRRARSALVSDPLSIADSVSDRPTSFGNSSLHAERRQLTRNQFGDGWRLKASTFQ